MFDYDKLTVQEKILFQRTKSELYSEAFLSDNPDMQKIDACFSTLSGLGYMESLPEPRLDGNFYALKDSGNEKHPHRRKYNVKVLARVAVAVAVILTLVCTVVAAQSSVRLDIWAVLGDANYYVYDENIDELYNPDAELTGVPLKRMP